MATISARGLGKSYAGKPAVVDLSFDVSPGSVTGFLGPNGSGKSTTMRLMLGLDNEAGTTLFDGKPFTSLPQPLRHVGALLEAKPYHPTRKARNHLRMLAAANGVGPARVDEVLAMVGLGDVARAKPKTFSLGMGQRLGLAAALLGDPHTLILDEPANGLDPQGIQWMRTLLRSLAAEGRSVLVSSHLLSEMALMADHLVVIGKGNLIATGPIAEFVGELPAERRDRADPGRRHPGPAAPGAGRRGGRGGGRAGGHRHRAGRGRRPRLRAPGPAARLSARVATLEEAFLERTAGSEEFQAQVQHRGDEGGAR